MTYKNRRFKLEFIGPDGVSGDINITLSPLQLFRLLNWFDDIGYDVINFKYIPDV